MSLGYASRLSFREDLGGRLGAPEHRDSEQNLKVKIDRLTEMVKTRLKRFWTTFRTDSRES